jgi:hypothetical protein
MTVMQSEIEIVQTEVTVVELAPNWAIIIPISLAVVGLVVVLLLFSQLRKRRK